MALNESVKIITATVTSGSTAGPSADFRSFITGCTFSLDADRVPFAAATIELEGAEELIPLFDPRTTGRTRVELCVQRDTRGDVDNRIEYWPGSAGFPRPDDAPAFLIVRRVTWDALADKLTVECAGYETALMDRARVGGALDTGCTTALALVQYGMDATFGSGTYTLVDVSGAAAAIALPSGDRRLIGPGQSYWDAFEDELNAASLRLFRDPAGTWQISGRDDPPRDASNATLDAWAVDHTWTFNSFYVSNVTQTLDREPWADTVQVEYSWTDSAGTAKTGRQTSGSGAKMLLINRERPVPGSNLATSIRGRALKAGSSFDVMGGLAFSARPGMTCTLHRASGNTSMGVIRAVEWDLSTAEMTLRTQIANPA